ncbi:Protein GrpE [bioreactor metagenome]|uniref:Protein GrpE n=1 Tax=bioreactor metagenome TaxID=1076179 RepID=A0A645G8R4_9ZZZZ
MSHKHQNEESHPGEWDNLPPEETTAGENKETGAGTEHQPSGDENAKLREELAETQNKLAYLQADYQNYRKRVAKDISDARIYGAANALEPFITVYDYLLMARQAAETSDKIEQIRQGLSMIIDQYVKAFEESGVSRIETAGKPFDPTVQEAVAHEASAEVPEGFVLKEWTGGYRFGERLLRPAKVVVSSGPAKAEKPADQEA